MKKYTIVVLLALSFLLVGCNKKVEITTASKDNVSSNNEVSTKLRNINRDNYIEIIDKNFGFSMETPAGWEVSTVRSPNSETNIEITFISNKTTSGYKFGVYLYNITASIYETGNIDYDKEPLSSIEDAKITETGSFNSKWYYFNNINGNGNDFVSVELVNDEENSEVMLTLTKF